MKTGTMPIAEIPTRRRPLSIKRRSSYPWASLDVGGFFVVPSAKWPAAQCAMSLRNKRHPETRFLARTVKGERRIIRVE